MPTVTHISWQKESGRLVLAFLRMEERAATGEVAFHTVAAVEMSDGQLQRIAAQLAELVHFAPPDEGAAYLLGLEPIRKEVTGNGTKPRRRRGNRGGGHRA